MFFKRNNGKSEKARRGRNWYGQSMMEAIIASGIIATAVSSALTLVQVSIGSEADSEAAIVAGNLAREGVEVVRSIRDSNWLAGDTWDQGLEGETNDHTAIPVFSPATRDWTLDFSTDGLDDDVTKVYRYTGTNGDAAIGLMVQASTPPEGTIFTGFNRLVSIDSICDLSGTIREGGSACGTDRIGLRVRSQVRFNVAGHIRTLEIEESLYNWR